MIGSLSGSDSWKTSGEQDKSAGQNAMKAAVEGRDMKQGYGRFEELAGMATGCDGMKQEGAASKGNVKKD